VAYDWHHRDGGVHKGADGCRGEDDVRDGVVDCEEGNGEACQEEENRDVKKGREGLNDNGHMKASHTLGEVRADAGTLMDHDVRLCQVEISAGPALLERRE
jgi:hypothetical protein